MPRLKRAGALIADLALSPFILAGGGAMKLARHLGIHGLHLSRSILLGLGIYPLREHYYDPIFNHARLRKPLTAVRRLPGLDLDIEGQLALVRKFRFTEELLQIPIESRGGDREYFYNCGWFESGDAEFYYSVMRHFRPRRLVEVGAGYSSMLARLAIARNAAGDPAYRCEHTCIEPFENPWLERMDVRVVRHRVEDVEEMQPGLFTTLERNDVLFIDSSHVIRPQGDVVCEILEILPTLRPGVLVHFHDIYTPRDNAFGDIAKVFYNEQYLLEAFLSLNREFRVVGALNHLAHSYPDELAGACPIYGMQREYREPGSFWIVRT
jgi:hypothetical protein